VNFHSFTKKTGHKTSFQSVNKDRPSKKVQEQGINESP